MSTMVMVPVKDLRQAKSRLSPLLSLDERRALASILLRGVLEQVATLPGDVRRAVVTVYPPAIEMAEGLGFEVMREPRQISESDSVDRAARLFESQGVGAVLRVPLDLPLLDAADLREILRLGEAGNQGILVPSLDGTGTNGLYRSPPSLFRSQFGPGSLALHEGDLRRLGVSYAVRAMPSMALDLDDGADLAELLRRGVACPAADYCRRIGVPERLAALAQTGA